MDLLSLSPPLLLAFFIYAVCGAVKRSKVRDELIPFIAMALGAILYPLIAEVGKVSYNVAHPTVFNAIMGACIGGFAIGLNQGYKQLASLRFSAAEDEKPQPDPTDKKAP